MKKLYIFLLILFAVIANAQTQSNYTRTWASYFGGTGFNISDAISDRNGNLIVAAFILYPNQTVSNDVNYYNQFKTPTGAPFQTGLSEIGAQSLIAKFSPSGVLLYATYVPYEVNSIQLTNVENNYIIKGATLLTTLGTAGTWMPVPVVLPTGSLYFIVTQLSENFTTNWCSYLPNDFTNSGTNQNLNIDLDNNIYMATSMFNPSATGITTANTFQPNFITLYDSNNNIIPNGYVCKMTNTGQLAWGSYLGLSFCSDALYLNGEVIVNGSRNEQLAAYNSYYCTQPNCVTSDAFYIITKFNASTGQRTLGKFMPTTTFVEGKMVTDGSNLYTLSAGNINCLTTPNAYQPSNNGITDLYLTKYNSSLQLQWATYIGGNGQETLGDSFNWFDYKDGYIYLSGWTPSSTNFINCPSAFSSSIQGTVDNFIMKFNTAGALIWGSYYGGSNSEFITSIIVPLANEAFYFCGTTRSTNNMSTAGSHQQIINFHPSTSSPFTPKENGYISRFDISSLNVANFNENELSIFPNPTKGTFTLQSKLFELEEYNFKLCNELGQLVQENILNKVLNTTIETKNLSAGIYLIHLQSKNSNTVLTKKLFVQ